MIDAKAGRAMGFVVMFVTMMGAARPSAAAQKAATATSANVLATERWVAAVQHHVPGVADPSVAEIWSLTRVERDWLPIRLERFRFFLVQLAMGHTATSTSPEEKRILEIAKDVQRVDARAFLERAIVLHTDAAVYAADAPVRQPTSSPAAAGAARGALVMATDGEYAGTSEADWNWPWARLLTKALLQLPDDGFTGAWYHASAAFMMRRRLYGEAGPHLTAAAAVLPDDVRIIFDRGCLAEALGLPRVQQLVTPEDRIAMAGTKSSTLHAQSWVDAARIPRAERANADAEELFRRALQVDAHHAEARVRLARILVTQGKFADASREAVRALGDSADHTVLFFAHLFAGRADRALGQSDLAARHFADAVALFPAAQSALLAQSQLALLRADVAGALAPIRQLAELPADAAARSDPWWQYDFGPGRLAQELARGLWARVRSDGADVSSGRAR